MKTLPREEANQLWDEYWDRMNREWFKVEVLQDYSAEDEGPSLKAWLEGDRDTSIQLIKEEQYPDWIEHCQQKIKQGVKLIRIHIVERPYSPYIEWEIEHYKLVNIPKCGEEVFLVDKREVSNQLPLGDMMIFDNRRVVVNDYTPNGLMTHQTFYDENDDIEEFLQLKKELTKLAKPLAERGR